MALAVVLVVLGMGGVIAFFSERDEATLGNAPPGTTAPEARDEVLAAGNVRITYSEPAHAAALRALAAEYGPDAPALRRAGQAVLVERDPGGAGIVARAWERRLEVTSPRDPQLRRFVEHWLGRGRG